MQKNNTGQTIIIRKKKGGGHGHHGGGWKVALADFMTAMMAFFLLMWLLETATPKEMAAISGYFQGEDANKYIIGPGGADNSVIELDAPTPTEPSAEDKEEDKGSGSPDEGENAGDPSDSETEYLKQEQETLAELKSQLTDEINDVDSALNPMKDQIHMTLTEQGLSIQIVDKDRRPMFDGGSSELHDYALDALAALSEAIQKVPNKITIVGHTDATQYGAGATYSNWELSADRANSARRTLIEAKYPPEQVIAVQGMADGAPLLPENPIDPANRRIAILVLKKAFSDAMVRTDSVPGEQLLESIKKSSGQKAEAPAEGSAEPSAVPEKNSEGWQPMQEDEPTDEDVIVF